MPLRFFWIFFFWQFFDFFDDFLTDLPIVLLLSLSTSSYLTITLAALIDESINEFVLSIEEVAPKGSCWNLGWNLDRSWINTPVGITTATTTIIKPIMLNLNLGCTSWWVHQGDYLEHKGEYRGNLGSEPYPVGIDTLTRRVESQSKTMGTGSP